MPAKKLFVTVGQRIGRGVVIEAEARGGGQRAVRLICDCGNEYVSAITALIRSRGESTGTQSCGCLRRERQIAAATTHGMSRRSGTHPLMKTWEGMIARCERPQAKDYDKYGGRGITVCEQWHDPRVFAADIESLIGPRPEGCTLDRKDNSGNYEPGNVQWATASAQAQNRRPRALYPHGPRARRHAKMCERCGDEYQSARADSRFCSKACKAAARRAVGADNILQDCHQCGGTFASNRYDGVRHCSQACAATCQHAGNCPARRDAG